MTNCAHRHECRRRITDDPGMSAFCHKADMATAIGKVCFSGQSGHPRALALAGLEWMFAPNWSLFVQYDYMDFGTHTDPLFFVDGSGPHTFDIKQHVQAAVVGISFRFGGPALGARY